MTIHATYEADGWRPLVSPISFGSSGVTTLIGATITADAVNLTTGAKVAATDVDVASATSVSCVFAPWSLVEGQWSVQVLATPVGFPPVTVMDAKLWVKKSASTQT